MWRRWRWPRRAPASRVREQAFITFPVQAGQGGGPGSFTVPCELEPGSDPGYISLRIKLGPHVEPVGRRVPVAAGPTERMVPVLLPLVLSRRRSGASERR